MTIGSVQFSPQFSDDSWKSLGTVLVNCLREFSILPWQQQLTSMLVCFLETRWHDRSGVASGSGFARQMTRRGRHDGYQQCIPREKQLVFLIINLNFKRNLFDYMLQYNRREVTRLWRKTVIRSFIICTFQQILLWRSTQGSRI